MRQGLVTGLAYGLGLLIGNIVSELIGNSIQPEEFLLSGSQGLRLVQGILLSFIIAGLGGFVGGFVGGWTLPVVGRQKGRWGYAWQSGFTLGVGYGVLVFPVMLIISLLSFYEVSAITSIVFSIIFGVVGLIFGLITGGVLGAWTLRRFYSPAAWGAALGFALGGVGLGYGIWRFLLSVTKGQVGTGSDIWLFLGLFFFGAFGGAGLGLIYERAVDNIESQSLLIHRLTAKSWVRRIVIVGVALFLLALLIRPVLASIGDLLTSVDAQLSTILDLNTIGTRWLDESAVANIKDPAPAIAADGEGNLALGWVDGDLVNIRLGEWSTDNKNSVWQAPFLVVDGAGESRSEVQVVLDDNGRSHVIWVETNGSGGSDIATSSCEDGVCTESIIVSSEMSGDCSVELGPANRHPSLALDGDGTLMLVWENETGVLPFATWQIDEEPPSGAEGCVSSSEAANGHNPRLSSDQNGTFVLVFDATEDEIRATRYLGGEWDAKSSLLGKGRLPEIFIDSQDQLHIAWCEADQVTYWTNESVETVSLSPCLGRPALGEDDENQMHVVWSADEVEDIYGRVNEVPVLMESVAAVDGWTPAAIVGQATAGTQLALSAAGDGSLHMVWNSPLGLSYAAQVQYRCDSDDLSRLSQIMYDIGRQETYIPPTDPVPYCQNQYDRLIITPNPNPAFSEQAPTDNGAFDVMADLIRSAEYEVLYSTMWYDSAVNHDSPGAVIAASVADLYNSVREHPEQYPRGMTVRILLDNPPEMARGDTSGQLWSLLGDLRHAGVDKMVDKDIGWRLEVADYEGNMPHSHVKTVVIDGKTAVAAGFNTTYNHFPSDHASGKGNDRFDLGLQLTGPVAQSALRMFDDMWIGADQRECLSFNPPFGIPWQLACIDKSANGDHLPEVLKYYLPEGSSSAFSLYRSKVHDAADIQTVEALKAARESIDVIQVNFTLDLICNLNILFNICPAEISPDYMPALIEAAENGARVRVLIKPSPFEGIENNVAIDALDESLSELGLEDQIEIRFYEKDMHPKVALIDDRLLIVGSQNFHYSAFGTGGGLNEFSFATDDEQAAEDFSRIFEYMWAQGVSPSS
jgi:phosphatidylserine/phosphatidylglycerophosphate/cardiolipin synthase-like enzyme